MCDVIMVRFRSRRLSDLILVEVNGSMRECAELCPILNFRGVCVVLEGMV